MLKNEIELVGTIIDDLEFSHEFCGEKFYITNIMVKRSSGNDDVIKLMISERILDFNPNDLKGKDVCINGSVRTYNMRSDDKTHLKVFVFVDLIEVLDIDDDFVGVNNLVLTGYLCKKSEPRKTPFGRTISDLVIAHNRNYGKSDYIPVITWNKNAYYSSTLPIGSLVKIEGRIQSRKYIKNNKECIVYEISAQTLAIVND